VSEWDVFFLSTKSQSVTRLLHCGECMTQELSEVVTVRFAKSVVDELKQLQVSIGIPPSEFIRRAVAEKLEKNVEVDSHGKQ
jgi:hypothetical protein